MSKPQLDPDERSEKLNRLTGWIRWLVILYRLAILSGLILFVLIIFGLILTSYLRVWFLAVPISLVLVGLILARVEFNLHKKLYVLKSETMVQEEINNEDT